MNYKKNLILLLSIANIALVIILLVNKKINIELFSQREVCPFSNDSTLNLPENTCSSPDDDEPPDESVILFPHYFILYFVVDDPETCPNAQSVNEIYDSYFSHEQDFHCIHTIKGNSQDFNSFIIANKCKPCGDNNNSSPCIYIRYPYKREFIKLHGNGFFSREFDSPNTKLSILSVNNYPLAEQFCETVKKSQDPLYNNGDCASFERDSHDYSLPYLRFNIRTFTSCDNTHQC